MLPGATTDTGTGSLTDIGWSNFKGHLTVYPGEPYRITITTATGSISLHVPPKTPGGVGGGGSTYYIDGGTGQFARVSGGSGLFSLDYGSRVTDSTGAHVGPFTAHLDGTIVFA